MNRFKQFALAATSVAICATAVSQTVQPTECSSTTVEKTLSSFVVAFDNLDWPSLKTCFAADASMFHPAPPNIKRIDSPENFEKAWLGVFARIKKESRRTSPPFMDLKPQDLQIQMLSPDVALVTFHLVNDAIVSRRTFVLKQDAEKWKIVHIHASNLSTAAP